mmetsp:Transcript_39290/g.95064  ORF Transcript_39290/g.95064 Transcript_39290/m.95064 type:complete len:208 (+) Transcript_39290:217-840(+)
MNMLWLSFIIIDFKLLIQFSVGPFIALMLLIFQFCSDLTLLAKCSRRLQILVAKGPTNAVTDSPDELVSLVGNPDSTKQTTDDPPDKITSLCPQDRYQKQYGVYRCKGKVHYHEQGVEASSENIVRSDGLGNVVEECSHEVKHDGCEFENKGGQDCMEGCQQSKAHVYRIASETIVWDFLLKPFWSVDGRCGLLGLGQIIGCMGCSG